MSQEHIQVYYSPLRGLHRVKDKYLHSISSAYRFRNNFINIIFRLFSIFSRAKFNYLSSRVLF